MFRSMIAFVVAVVALSAHASAATVTVTDLGPANALPIAFAPADVKSSTGVDENVTGTISTRRTPWEGTAFEATGLYTSVGANAFATYLVGPSTSLSLVWGSPDDYNKLSFFSGNTLLGVITGQQVLDDVKPLSTQPNSKPSNGYAFVSLALGDGSVFDTVTFESIGSNAFEYGGVAATPVPLPAAGWMLLGGLAGLNWLRRRAKA